MKEELMVSPEKLRYFCNPADFGFKTTSKVAPIKGFIGQKRAEEAIRFGLEVDNPDYNICATGHTGKGKKKAVLCDFLEKMAEEKMASGKVVLKDVCCLHNFHRQDRPKVVFFDKGGARKFKKQVETLLRDLKCEISDLFHSKEYLSARDEILKEFDAKKDSLINSLNGKVRGEEFIFLEGRGGYSVAPASKEADQQGKPKIMPPDEYDSLPEAERKRLEEVKKRMGDLIQRTDKKISDFEIKAKQEITELADSSLKILLNLIFLKLGEEYAGSGGVSDYLRGLKDYVFRNVNLFNNQQANNGSQIINPLEAMGIMGREANSFLPFEVNILVDNAEKNNPPVIFESNPSFDNLFCEIERKFSMGGYFTDHTCLKAGSLAQANGGYLVLNIRDVLENSGVWPKLKKTLRQERLEFEEPFNGLKIVPLNPEPMPINLKVIIIGEPELYDLLIQYDPDFLAIFKVKAEFDSDMPLTQENKNNYAGFISACCKKENLLPFDSTGVAKVVETGARFAGSQLKLSTKFDEIKDLVIEASYWAGRAGAAKVKSEHVIKALEAQRLRLNLSEEKIQELIEQEILLIDTVGRKAGQINGLAVYDCGDYRFGRPNKITANAYTGERGVVSIQRETKMSGNIHNAGVQTLSSYFSKKYGQDREISFSASISFEQCYSGVEGDSASAAELICLISGLSGLPINQGYAVTGSVNQKGEIQPIGGINEKIEGFFDVCKERGLTGEQGVVMPHQNIQNLILKEEVVESCRQGKFRIISIKTIDEALEIMMDKSAGMVHAEVNCRLLNMKKKTKK